MSVGVLGLDLSLTRTGWAGPDVNAFGDITTNLRGAARLDYIERQIGKLLYRQDEKAALVDVVVLEGYAYGARNHREDLGELGGVVRLFLWRLGIPYAIVPPAKLKKFTTGKGNASKDECLSAAIRRFGFEGSTNDAADAFMLARMGRGHYDALPSAAYQDAVVASIDWPRPAGMPVATRAQLADVDMMQRIVRSEMAKMEVTR